MANATAEGSTHDYHVVGGLLEGAAISAFIGLVVSMCLLGKPLLWVNSASAFWTLIAFALGLTVEIYFYIRIYYDRSAFLAATAMVLSLTCFTITFEMTHNLKFSPINWFTSTH